MMASKGLEGDLASSLPRLLERSGVFHVQLEELLPRQPGESRLRSEAATRSVRRD